MSFGSLPTYSTAGHTHSLGKNVGTGVPSIGGLTGLTTFGRFIPSHVLCTLLARTVIAVVVVAFAGTVTLALTFLAESSTTWLPPFSTCCGRTLPLNVLLLLPVLRRFIPAGMSLPEGGYTIKMKLPRLLLAFIPLTSTQKSWG